MKTLSLFIFYGCTFKYLGSVYQFISNGTTLNCVCSLFLGYKKKQVWFKMYLMSLTIFLQYTSLTFF